MASRTAQRSHESAAILDAGSRNSSGPVRMTIDDVVPKSEDGGGTEKIRALDEDAGARSEGGPQTLITLPAHITPTDTDPEYVLHREPRPMDAIPVSLHRRLRHSVSRLIRLGLAAAVTIACVAALLPNHRTGPVSD